MNNRCNQSGNVNCPSLSEVTGLSDRPPIPQVVKRDTEFLLCKFLAQHNAILLCLLLCTSIFIFFFILAVINSKISVQNRSKRELHLQTAVLHFIYNQQCQLSFEKKNVGIKINAVLQWSRSKSMLCLRFSITMK